MAASADREALAKKGINAQQLAKHSLHDRSYPLIGLDGLRSLRISSFE